MAPHLLASCSTSTTFTLGSSHTAVSLRPLIALVPCQECPLRSRQKLVICGSCCPGDALTFTTSVCSSPTSGCQHLHFFAWSFLWPLEPACATLCWAEARSAREFPAPPKQEPPATDKSWCIHTPALSPLRRANSKACSARALQCE